MPSVNAVLPRNDLFMLLGEGRPDSLGSSSWCCQPITCPVLSYLWPWGHLPFSHHQWEFLDVSPDLRVGAFGSGSGLGALLGDVPVSPEPASLYFLLSLYSSDSTNGDVCELYLFQSWLQFSTAGPFSVSSVTSLPGKMRSKTQHCPRWEESRGETCMCTEVT